MDPSPAARALSFGAAAEAYAAARPTYPVDAVRFVLPSGAQRVLDLGAGTGKLTTVLLDLGLDVVAVEPDDQMRALVDPRATVLAGTAEDVPLEAGSVDAVVVGQAWHWFDRQAAVASVHRVLRPGGTLGLLWNVLDDRTGWPSVVIGHLQLEDRLSLTEQAPKDRPYDEPDGLGPWERALFDNPQPADQDLVLQNFASRSLLILMDPVERAALLGRIRADLPYGDFDVPWVTEAWRAEKP